ncbi:DUF803-domain-containing protein [Exidia glandulosa HHB12029]|uniref:DUF803-domain-containing protein n=1 Tax=Exidia glandulosa HHB12029 TaxID=1314781 RepID=A0A166A102_EXIGL|nr:DUF803-domain-containing protein [Exidia glandulosa HHB12029]
MWADKYIGMLLAVVASFGIGASSIVAKIGLNDVARKSSSGKSASDGFGYLTNSIWWAGSALMVIGEVANFAAYTYAPPILVTPLGALSVIFAAILASFILNEHLGHLGRVGAALCMLGSIIIVLHAPEDKEVSTVDEIVQYALNPAFMLYCLFVLVFIVYMIYYVAPTHGPRNPLVWISMCSFAGSVSIMCIKGFGTALKLTFEGHNQFGSLATYVLAAVAVGCLLLQMYYYTKVLDRFNTNLVNPIYYVMFSSATIVASLLLFQGFNTTDGSSILSLLAGFVTTFIGVHLLNYERLQEADESLPRQRLPQPLQLSVDPEEGGVHGSLMRSAGAETPTSASWRTGTHIGRGGDVYRAQSSALVNAFEMDDTEGGGISTHSSEESVLLHQRRWSLEPR